MSAETLLHWERHYGFPRPQRDAAGLRHYPADQVLRLRTIRQALDAGLALDRAFAAASCELSTATTDAGRDRRQAVVNRLVAHDVGGLLAALEGGLAELGLDRFVREVVAPLNVDVGDAWMQGRIEVYQEHLYTEAVQGLLRHALHGLTAPEPRRPAVLLTTASGELHGLGLLMAEAVLRLAGCRCVSLGVQTPLWDVVRAATALQIDVVALSHSGVADPARLVDDLQELRRKLPRGVELWAGGRAAPLHRQAIDGVHTMAGLEQAVEAVAAWRERRQSPDAFGNSP